MIMNVNIIQNNKLVSLPKIMITRMSDFPHIQHLAHELKRVFKVSPLSGALVCFVLSWPRCTFGSLLRNKALIPVYSCVQTYGFDLFTCILFLSTAELCVSNYVVKNQEKKNNTNTKHPQILTYTK